MEDVQPNEVRLSRKGSTSIPRVRTTTGRRKYRIGRHDVATSVPVKPYHHPQSHDPGPSRFNSRPTAPDSRSAAPFSSHFAQRGLFRSSTLHINSPQPSRQRPTSETIIKTLDPPSPVVEQSSFRWSTFRSGHVDICLRPLNNGSRASPSNQNAGPRPDTRQNSAQVVGLYDIPSVPSSDTKPCLVRPNIRTNYTVAIGLVGDCRTDGSFSDRFSPLDTLEAARSSHSNDSSQVRRDQTPLAAGTTPTCSKLHLSLGSYDKPRRILRDDDSVHVVTAHGVIDKVRATGVLKLNRNIRSPPLPLEEFVDDACILSYQGESIIVLGHAREQDQITVLDLGHSNVSPLISLPRDWNSSKRSGVSAMTTLMSPLKFASGGYDHRIHLWDIAQDLSGIVAVELAVKHTSAIHSLLPVVDTSHKLVSVGADRSVPIYDISSERVVQTLETSCMPFHAHKTNSPSCTLLEVAHLETQFEVRDHRMSHQVTQRFGFITPERRGRFDKADTWSHFVVCGDKNGVVHLWDRRNVSKEVTLPQCCNNPVVQVVKAGPRLLVSSKRNELACIQVDLPASESG